MSADRRLLPKNFSVVNNLPKKSIQDRSVSGEEVLGGVMNDSDLFRSVKSSISEVGCPKLPVKNSAMVIENEIHRDKRFIKNV